MIRNSYIKRMITYREVAFFLSQSDSIARPAPSLILAITPMPPLLRAERHFVISSRARSCAAAYCECVGELVVLFVPCFMYQLSASLCLLHLLRSLTYRHIVVCVLAYRDFLD